MPLTSIFYIEYATETSKTYKKITIIVYLKDVPQGHPAHGGHPGWIYSTNRTGGRVEADTQYKHSVRNK